MKSTGVWRLGGLGAVLVALASPPAARAQSCTPQPGSGTNCSGGNEVVLYCDKLPDPLVHTILVPASCDYMLTKLWGNGANAGCGGFGCGADIYAAGSGGGGGAAVVSLKVNPGEGFRAIVRDEGFTSGGRMGMPTSFEKMGSPNTLVALAAGGGGGGRLREMLPCFPQGGGPVPHGGAGGGMVGQDGVATWFVMRAKPGVPWPDPGCASDPLVIRDLGAGGGATQLVAGKGGVGYPTPASNGSDGDTVGWGGQHAGDGGLGSKNGGGGGGSVVKVVNPGDNSCGPYTGCQNLSGAGGGGGSSYTSPLFLGGVYAGSRAVPGLALDGDRGVAGNGGLTTATPSDGLGIEGRIVVRMRAACAGGGTGPACGPYPDPPAAPGAPLSIELTHGYRAVETFPPAAPPERIYRIKQDAYAAYEIVVDGTSGDIGNAPSSPLVLQRLDLQGNVLQSSVPTGPGPGRSLRWQNTSNGPVSDHLIRVASGSCTSNCGQDDVYRIRAYDTTYTIPRFNNGGSQATVVLLQNPTASSISLRVHLWAANGVLITTQSPTLAAKSVYVLDTSTVAAGQSGSITITTDAPYGRLAGKAVALEPATGFTFDTLMVPRPR